MQAYIGHLGNLCVHFHSALDSFADRVLESTYLSDALSITMKQLIAAKLQLESQLEAKTKDNSTLSSCLAKSESSINHLNDQISSLSSLLACSESSNNDLRSESKLLMDDLNSREVCTLHFKIYSHTCRLVLSVWKDFVFNSKHQWILFAFKFRNYPMLYPFNSPIPRARLNL